MATFGQRIRELRKAKGFTQRELADLVGINFTYLSKIENGKLEQDQSPRGDTIQSMAEALDADADELMLLARKIPESIKQLVIDRPEIFKKMITLTEDQLDRLAEEME